MILLSLMRVKALQICTIKNLEEAKAHTSSGPVHVNSLYTDGLSTL